VPYEFTLLAVPYVIALGVSGALWPLLWQHRERRAARGFLLDVTGVVLLSAVVILKITATDLETKLFWWNWRFLAVSAMSIGYLLMAVEYTDNEDLWDWRIGVGLGTVAVLTTVAAVTNQSHGLLYSTDGLEGGLLVPSFGPLYWLYATVMVGCIVVGVGLLLNTFRSHVGFGLQTAVLVGTITLVMGGVVLWWLRIVPLDTLALTSTVKVVGFYLAVDRLQLLETMPVARATMFRNMKDAVFVLSGSARIVDVNPAAKSVVGDRSVVHERIDEVLDVDLEPNVTAANGPEGADGTIVSRELTLDRDGEPRYYDLELSRFPDGSGAVAVLRDVTEQRNREREIMVLNRIVRHDIRNEMNVLHGRGQLLEDHLDPAGEEDYRLVMESAQHVIEITETVRELMETITADGSMDVRPISLEWLLESEVTKARSNFPEATIDLDEVPAVSVEGNEMLSSVFTNLLNNAIIHNTSTHPSVWVDVTEDGDTVRISVADDGPGVPPDRREEIFGRGEKGLESEGTGVGLYLVDTLTSEFGGDVWVEDSEHGGATFVVTLPFAETDATSDEHPSGTPPPDE